MFLVEHLVLFYFNLLSLFISGEESKNKKDKKRKEKGIQKRKKKIHMEPK